MDHDRLRAKWRLDPDVAFLNHGSFGASPRPVLVAQARLRAEMERAPVDFLDRRLPGLLAAARAGAADFLGADPEGLAFVPNATVAISTVLRGLMLEPGDEIVVTDHAYPAVDNAVARICAEVGARAVVVPVPLPFPPDAEVVERITGGITSRARVVIVDHVSSSTAAIFPVAEVVAAVRERGVPVMVDGAHAPGMVEVAIDALAPDYWAGVFHKWVCAPKGAGALWVRDRAVRARLAPPVVSHAYLKTFHERFDWPGTYDPTAILSVPAAVDFFAKLGWEDVRAHNHALVLAGRDGVAAAIGARPVVPDDATGSMAIVPLPDGVASSRDAARAMTTRLHAEHRIEVPVVPWNGRAYVRISAHVYNRPDDYARLARALPEVLRAWSSLGE